MFSGKKMEGRKNKSSFSFKQNDHVYTRVRKRGFNELLTSHKTFFKSTVAYTCAVYRMHNADKKFK